MGPRGAARRISPCLCPAGRRRPLARSPRSVRARAYLCAAPPVVRVVSPADDSDTAGPGARGGVLIGAPLPFRARGARAPHHARAPHYALRTSHYAPHFRTSALPHRSVCEVVLLQ